MLATWFLNSILDLIFSISQNLRTIQRTPHNDHNNRENDHLLRHLPCARRCDEWHSQWTWRVGGSTPSLRWRIWREVDFSDSDSEHWYSDVSAPRSYALSTLPQHSKRCFRWPFHHVWLDAQKLWPFPDSYHVRTLSWESQWQRWARVSHRTALPSSVRPRCRLCATALGQGAGGSAPTELHFWAFLSSWLDLSEVVKWKENNNNSDNDKNNT